jgi:predicted dehydrogenase
MSDIRKAPPSRRLCLKTIGKCAIDAGVLGATAQQAQSQQDDLKTNEKLPPEKLIGWALVGLSEFGTKQILPSFADSKRSKIIGFVSEVKRFRVFGEKAWLELDPATDYYEHRMLIGRKNPNASEENKTAPKFIVEEQQIQEGNQFAAEIDHLSQCIQENREPKTPGAEGLQDVRLMQLIYQAAREGKTIKVPVLAQTKAD